MASSELEDAALAAIGLGSIVAGAYLTGTTGDVHVLLITGLGMTTVWLALRADLQDAEPSASDVEPTSDESAAQSEGSA